MASSSFFEIRLFYVRISPCSIDTVPSSLTLSHLRRSIGVCLEINGAKIPSSDPTSLLLCRDRIDREASEVTYVSTDDVKLTGAVDFEVCDDKGNLIFCGSLETMEAAWSNGSIGSCGDKDPKTGWSMDCYLAASIGGSGFVQHKLGIVSPLIDTDRAVEPGERPGPGCWIRYRRMRRVGRGRMGGVMGWLVGGPQQRLEL